LGVDITGRLKFKNSELGYVRVEDGSILVLRVALVDVRERRVPSPFGIEFDVNFNVGLAVYPSEESLREVEGKPVLESGRVAGEGWAPVKIVEKTSAYEEAIYVGEDGRQYLVRVEVEPIMASKNTMYRAAQGAPLYAVRWVPKVTWYEARTSYT